MDPSDQDPRVVVSGPEPTSEEFDPHPQFPGCTGRTAVRASTQGWTVNVYGNPSHPSPESGVLRGGTEDGP